MHAVSRSFSFPYSNFLKFLCNVFNFIQKYSKVSLVPGVLMFYGRYTHVEDDEEIIGEAQKPFSIQDGGFTNMSYNMSLYDDIRSVLAMAITGLERPVLQTFRNEKRMFSTIVVLKRRRF